MPDPSLEDLPEKKADLEEASMLLDRLEDRKGETDPDRYERLAGRYQETIDRLEPEVEQLTEEGQTRKLELENRLAHQRERAEDAAAELEEIKQLHEEGAMDEDSYQEDRRRFQKQKRDAEKKIEQIERELDEVEFYLSKTGDVNYRTGEPQRQSTESDSQMLQSSEKAWMRLSEWTARATMPQPKVLASGVVVLVLLVATYFLWPTSSAPPSESDARSKLQKLISERSGGIIELVELNKSVDQKGGMAGVSYYTLGVEGRIEFKENCLWNPPDLMGSGKPFTVNSRSGEGTNWEDSQKTPDGFKPGSKGEQHTFTGAMTFEEKESGWSLSETDLQVQNDQQEGSPPAPWRTTKTRWWLVGADTSKVFPDLNSLATMGVTDQKMSMMRSGEVTQERFKLAIKQSLLKLYRNSPMIVDSLFEEHAVPHLEEVDLSGNIVGKKGQLKSKIRDKNQKKAYQAITEHFREPQRQSAPDIVWPDSLRSEEYSGIVELQVHLVVEGDGDNAVARADAVEILSGPNLTLNKIAARAATRATWQPAYLLKDDNWTPVDSWVRFSVPFQMR